MTDEVYFWGRTPAKPNVEDWNTDDAMFMMNTETRVRAKNAPTPGAEERGGGRGEAMYLDHLMDKVLTLTFFCWRGNQRCCQ